MLPRMRALRIWGCFTFDDDSTGVERDWLSGSNALERAFQGPDHSSYSPGNFRPPTSTPNPTPTHKPEAISLTLSAP
jgi:hypothetical protein